MLKTSFARMLSLFAALLAVALWVGAAQAQTPHSISGSFGQFFIGQGLPIPHPSFGPFNPNGGQTFTGMAPTFMGTPVGGAKATPYAFAVTSNTGATFRMLSPHKITHGDVGNPQPGINQPVFFANSAVFQVYTNLSLLIPRIPPTGTPQSGQMSDSAFFANGRTGPNVLSWCPGNNVSPNPGCSLPTQAPVITIPSCAGPGSCPGAGTLMTQIPGSVRYNRTAGQLGGAARGNVGGTFDVALNPYGATMTNSPATVFFVGGSPNQTGAIGAEFGVFNQRAVPSLMGIVVSGFTSLGNIGGMTQMTGITPPAGLGANNTIASFGVPFTAGQIILSVTANLGADEVFTLTGSDNRTSTSGAGNLTLVGGAVSLRSTTGLNANRGIVSFSLPEPTAIVGAAGALLVLLGCHQLVRRRR